MNGQTIMLSSPDNRRTAKQWIDTAPMNAVCNVRKPNRTHDQNAKMWAMLSDVSRAKPDGRKHTPDVWKALFMHACGHQVQFEVGLAGEPFPIGFRSSKLKVGEMADLITFIQQWGDEHGIHWSDEARAA